MTTETQPRKRNAQTLPAVVLTGFGAERYGDPRLVRCLSTGDGLITYLVGRDPHRHLVLWAAARFRVVEAE